MDITTRAATADDLDSILRLLPRLADYELPDRRTADMFWSADAALAHRWAAGGLDDVFVRVAMLDGQVVGAAIVTMGEDHFSHAPCGHLEVVVVDPIVDGQRVGSRLIGECEAEIVARGGQIISLHVVGNNHRARQAYQRLGFAEEMIRATKFLTD